LDPYLSFWNIPEFFIWKIEKKKQEIGKNPEDQFLIEDGY